MASADLNTAERLLRHGCPDEQVERATGASLSEILDLRASLASTAMRRPYARDQMAGRPKGRPRPA